MPECLEAPKGGLRATVWVGEVSHPPYLTPGRSKVLWLHGLFSFFYFLTNLIFMAHHCLGFVPKESSKVRKWKELPELFSLS